LNAPENIARASDLAQIPRGEDGPVFPTPWAARAFALAVALNEAGLFAWSEWAEALGAELAGQPDAEGSDPEDYWRAWLAALESMLRRKGMGDGDDLFALREAWRRFAEVTPHGEPIELAAGWASRPST